MLDKNYIKPIPKKIIAAIKREDKKHHTSPCSNTRCYSYLSTWKKELVKVTVAVRHYKEQWYCKQVAVHGLRSSNALVKDVEYFTIAGYVVGWYDLKACARKKTWEDGLWYSCNKKYFDMYAPCVNLDYLERFPEYQYSEYKQVITMEILSYLRLYEKFPEAEYLLKSNLKYYATSKTILQQVQKDKSFHKWLIANKDFSMINGRYYCNALIEAYKKHLPIKQVQAFVERKHAITHDYCGKRIVNAVIKKGVKGEFERFFKYIDKHGINEHVYYDYVRACQYLEKDLSDDKIRYPRNFRHWHNFLIQEMELVQEEERRKSKRLRTKEAREYKKKMEKEKRELTENFLKAAEKYLPLAGFTEDEHYAIFIAQSQEELIKEGNALSHCVGRSGYDKKMAREETLIFFVRKFDDLDTPFVTLEYSIKHKKILQCYAYDNQKPDDNVIEFVNKKWLPHANEQLEKIAA